MLPLTNGAGILAAGQGGGDVAIYARNINISQGSLIEAGIVPNSVATKPSGDIVLNAVESTTIDNSFVYNGVFSGAAGNAGKISLDTGTLSLTAGGQIYSNIYRGSKGNAGAITVIARDKASISGVDGGNLSSGIFSNVNQGAQGNSGGIGIQAASITLEDGSRIEASTFGQGNAGNIIVQASDFLSISQKNRGAVIRSDVASGARGNSGGINITTGSLKVLDGGNITSNVRASGRGNSGGVNITASRAVLLDGQDDNFSATTFLPSAIFSRVERNGEGNAGNITVKADSLSVTNRAQIASTTAGRGNAGNVTLSVDQQTFLLNSLIISEVTERSGVGNGGDLNLTTGSLVLRNGAGLLADTENRGNAGNIFIVARGDVVLDGIGPSAGDRNQTISSQISTSVESGAVGQGGRIEIAANSLSVLDRGFISSSTAGRGNAGNINLNIDKQTLLLNSLIISEVTERSGVGNGGDLNLTTGSLVLRNGSSLLADTENRGNAGNIFIVARGGLLLDGTGPSASDRNQIIPSQISTTVESDAIGQGGKIEVTASSLSVVDGGFISSTTFGQGDANDIRIRTDTLTLRDGAQLSSRTEGANNAGNIFVIADDSIIISGIDADGFRSGLFANTGTASKGNAGNITLQARSFFLSDRAIVASSSRGQGDAGDITIRAGNRFNLTNSDITTSANASSGGAINITAGKVRLIGDSDISSSVASGINGGGNIQIAADYILALDDSDIFAFSKDGQGGNITLSRAYFGVGFQPSSLQSDPQTLQGNDRPDINATGQVSSGIVSTPDNSFIQNGLTQLSDNLIDPNTLLANSCIVRNREQNGQFFITGSGGLPVRPGDAPLSSFPTGEVRSLPEAGEKQGAESGRSWQAGDPIVEPQGIYRLSNGKLVMSRECENQ